MSNALTIRAPELFETAATNALSKVDDVSFAQQNVLLEQASECDRLRRTIINNAADSARRFERMASQAASDPSSFPTDPTSWSTLREITVDHAAFSVAVRAVHRLAKALGVKDEFSAQLARQAGS